MNFKDFSRELQNKTGHDYQKYIYEILKPLIPSLKYAKDLNVLDKSGVDLVWIEGDDYIQTIQCKGFDVAGFGESQFKQCQSSVKSFIKSGIKTEEYIFIINRGSNSVDYNKIYKQKLLDEIAKVKIAGKADEVTLYDNDTFANYIRSSIEVDIRNRILKSTRSFREDYNNRMQQGIYLYDTPFTYETYSKTEKNHNPINFINDRLVSRIHHYDELITTLTKRKSSVKNDWLFVMSEFGFGKTSLLLNSADKLSDSKKMFLYLPVALLSKDFIIHKNNVSKNILQIFLDFNPDEGGITSSLYPPVLSKLLKTRTDLILLIDGIDEGSFLYYDNALKQFFNLFKDYNTPIVFSVRKEFYYERGNEFSKAIKSDWNDKKIIFLEEWGIKEMSFYVNSLFKIHKNKDLLKFKKLIENNEYNTLYGDIPKRPLFLKMICEDILNGDTEQKSIDELYEGYFLRKFDIDRDSSIGADAKEGRPLTYGEGEQKIAYKIMQVLEEVAGMLIAGSKNEEKNIEHYYKDKTENLFQYSSSLIIKENIEEEELEVVIKKYFPNSNEIMDFLLHSVLVPEHKRKGASMRLRFAHKSFQEFFTKKFLENSTKLFTD